MKGFQAIAAICAPLCFQILYINFIHPDHTALAYRSRAQESPLALTYSAMLSHLH
jgi:hypothetical protein